MAESEEELESLLKNSPQFAVIHTVKGFGVVNEAEVDVFLELSSFLSHPTGIGILIYTEHIMRNAGLDEAQAWIKIAGRNVSNLRYADDTILMAEVKRN